MRHSTRPKTDRWFVSALLLALLPLLPACLEAGRHSADGDKLKLGRPTDGGIKPPDYVLEEPPPAVIDLDPAAQISSNGGDVSQEALDQGSVSAVVSAPPQTVSIQPLPGTTTLPSVIATFLQASPNQIAKLSALAPNKCMSLTNVQVFGSAQVNADGSVPEMPPATLRHLGPIAIVAGLEKSKVATTVTACLNAAKRQSFSFTTTAGVAKTPTVTHIAGNDVILSAPSGTFAMRSGAAARVSYSVYRVAPANLPWGNGARACTAHAGTLVGGSTNRSNVDGSATLTVPRVAGDVAPLVVAVKLPEMTVSQFYHCVDSALSTVRVVLTATMADTATTDIWRAGSVWKMRVSSHNDALMTLTDGATGVKAALDFTQLAPDDAARLANLQGCARLPILPRLVSHGGAGDFETRADGSLSDVVLNLREPATAKTPVVYHGDLDGAATAVFCRTGTLKNFAVLPTD